MRRWPATLRGRLTLWYTIVLGVPLVAFAEIGYLTFASALHQRTEGFIGEALTAFTRELAAERRVHDSSEEAVRTTVAEVRFRDLRIEVRDASGRLIAVSEEGGGGARRVVERDVTVDGDPYHVRASYPQADEEAVLERIRVVFLLAVPILLVCAGTGGFFLASRGLRPVGDMAARAMEISASTLHERLPVSGGEELTGLARVVNALLDRLGPRSSSSGASWRTRRTSCAHPPRSCGRRPRSPCRDRTVTRRSTARRWRWCRTRRAG